MSFSFPYDLYASNIILSRTPSPFIPSVPPNPIIPTGTKRGVQFTLHISSHLAHHPRFPWAQAIGLDFIAQLHILITTSFFFFYFSLYGRPTTHPVLAKNLWIRRRVGAHFYAREYFFLLLQFCFSARNNCTAIGTVYHQVTATAGRNCINTYRPTMVIVWSYRHAGSHFFLSMCLKWSLRALARHWITIITKARKMFAPVCFFILFCWARLSPPTDWLTGGGKMDANKDPMKKN